MRLPFVVGMLVLVACGGSDSAPEDARVSAPDARAPAPGAEKTPDGAVDARVGDATSPLTPDIGTTSEDAGTTNEDAGTTRDAAVDAQAPVATVSERQACLAYVDAICQREGGCSPSGNYERCMDRLGSRCPDLAFGPGATNDPAALLACAPETKKLSCNMYYAGVTPACAAKGTRAAGESCISGSQCASSSCSGQWGECGVCLARVPTGGSCSSSRECEAGNRCSGVNGSCYRETDGGPERRYLGEACSPSIGCVDGTTCAGNVCVVTPLGSSCYSDSCSADAFCDSYTATCKELPRAGEPCASAQGIFDLNCAPEAFCLGQCVKSAALGEDCKATADHCQPGLRCTSTAASERRCKREREEGESCTDPLDICTQGTACTSGVCVSAYQGLADCK